MNFGLKRVEVSKHIRNIIKKLAENADGTLMPPLIPDWRYLTEENQIALARFAERIRWSRERFE